MRARGKEPGGQEDGQVDPVGGVGQKVWAVVFWNMLCLGNCQYVYLGQESDCPIRALHASVT
jgi:hypothetical protein